MTDLHNQTLIFKHLILWRHAEAEDLMHGQQDSERALTSKGKVQAKRMAAWLERYLPKDTLVLVSPAKRAIQTVEAWRRDYQTIPQLSPEADAKDIAQWLSVSTPQASSVILVGHQPWIGELASFALTSHYAPLSFKKGAVWWMSLSNKGHKNGMPYKLYSAQTPDLT